jgi:pyruvate,water dikinase
MARLRKLRTRVAEELIPALEAEGTRLAGEDLEARTTEQLAAAIEERLALVRQWTKTYWEEFIPFAHGVRRLVHYYNDAVRPRDPYEFVGLLQGEDLLATQRNDALRELADRLRRNPMLCDAIAEACGSTETNPTNWEQEARTAVRLVAEGETFLIDLRRTMETVLDLAYGNTRLADRPDLILRAVLEQARAVDQDVLRVRNQELTPRRCSSGSSQRSDLNGEKKPWKHWRSAGSVGGCATTTICCWRGSSRS